MVSSARQRGAMVNAAASYLERVRQEAYANIGTPGGDPSGDLIAQISASTPYVISVTPAVTWGRPENTADRTLKTVTLSVSSSSLAGGSQMTLTSATLVADIGAVGAPAFSAATTPTAAITSPAAGSVVWGPSVSVTTSGTANSASDTLAFMDVIDGAQMWGSAAVSGVSVQHVWTWNTTAAREGNHQLTPKVTDSAGTTVNGTPVIFTVDNLPPTVPGSLGSTFPSGATGSAWWAGSTDGTDIDAVTALGASHYVAAVYRQPSGASSGDYTAWSPVTGLTGLSIVTPPSQASPLALSGLSGFSRYCVAVAASSPDRGTASGLQSASAVTVGVTESIAAGTWAVSPSGKNYAVTVTVNAPVGPTFPWTGTATTRIYRMTSQTQTIGSGTLIGTISSASPNWSAATATDTQSTKGTPTAYFYAAITSLTPAGYGSAPVTVDSCVLGPPADTTTTGTRNLVIAQW
jgi:hypothetical protein